MHRIAGLKRYDAPPSALGEFRSQLRRSWAQRFEIIVYRQLNAFQLPAHVPRIRLLQQILDARMTETRRSKHGLCFRVKVRLPDFLHMQRREHHALCIPKGHLLTRSERLRELLRHIQHHGNRPKLTIRQSHARASALVVREREESAQWRKPAIEQEFEIAKLFGR